MFWVAAKHAKSALNSNNLPKGKTKVSTEGQCQISCLCLYPANGFAVLEVGLLSVPYFLIIIERQLKTTRRHSPLHGPTSSSCGGLQPWPEAFFALWKKKPNMLF